LYDKSIINSVDVPAAALCALIEKATSSSHREGDVGYFILDDARSPSSKAQDEVMQKKLWEETVARLGLESHDFGAFYFS